MSYDLDIFRGDVDDEPDDAPPLDEAIVRAAFAELDGVEEGATELYWRLPSLHVTFMLLRRSDGKLSSLGVLVQSGDDTASDAQARDDYDKLLDFCLELTRRLEARLTDAQLDEYVTSANRAESRASFAGGP